MAVDLGEYIQGPSAANLKPTRLANELAFWLSDRRRVLSATLAQGGLLVGYWIAPWAGVIESVRTTQLVAGAGGGVANTIALSVGGTNAFTLAADGSTILDNAAAGTTALTAPTAGRVASPDGVLRFHFNKGDAIVLTGVPTAAQYGTARTDIVIARENAAGI